MIGRRAAAFGTIGSHSGSQEHYYTKNTLHIEEVSMRVNQQNHFYPIIKHGNWVVKKLNFKIDDTVTMRIKVDGSGIGYAYASYLDEEGSTQLLFIKKVQHGIYEDSFVVPSNVLKNVKVGISTTIPQGAKIDYLSDKDKHAIKRNALLVSQALPMYETDGLGGLGGFSDLGAMYNINQPATGGRYGKYALWDGDLSNHSWTTHGYTGQKEHDPYAGEGPPFKVEKTAYYCARSSFYLARFTPDGKFMGWQAITGNWLQQTIPAGVPICMVQQHYYLTAFSKTGYGDAEMNPKWRYMKNMKTVASLFFAYHRYFERTWNPSDKQRAGRRHGSDDGVIKYNMPATGLNYSKKDKNGNWIVDNAIKLEWLDPDTNSWTDLRATPGFYPDSNSKGKSMWIFRFPRQLDPVDDKKRVEELRSYGIDYSLDRTKDAYPRVTGEGEVHHVLVGRPKPDGVDDHIWQENGKKYRVLKSFDAECYIRFDGKKSAGDSPYDRYEKLPDGLNVTDGEKLAKYNYPELFNTYYAAGEFNAGDTIFAIGKGLGSGSRCIVTKNKDDHSGDIDQKYYITNNVEKVSDGSMIGTRDGDYLQPSGIIDADEVSEGELANYPDLDATWKKVFGSPLTAEFFTSDVARKFLKQQNPDNPLHYLETDLDTNDTYSFPYQIIWFKIPMDYYGPYVDYEPFEEEKDGMIIKTMKIVAPEDKPYAVKGTNDPIYLNVTTGFRKYASQKFELVDEITEQRELEAAGLDPESIIMANQTNYESEDVTAEESQQQVEQLYLERTNSDTSPEAPAKKKHKGDKYVKSWWEARFSFSKPKDFVYESQLKEEGLLGFSNDRNFYVEDVTQKWGDLNGMHLPEGSYSTEMMPETNPEAPFDPMLGLGALGAFEDLGNVLEDVGIVDSEEENWEDVQRDAGYLLQATANAGVEVARGMWHVGNGDLSKARKSFGNVDDYLLDANPNDDSVLTISANMVRNAGVASTQGTASAIDDLIDDLSGGPRYTVSNTGLGEISADKMEEYGEKSAAFGKGVVKRLLPDSLVEAYDKNPILYSAALGGFVLLGIPFIGPTVAKTIGQSGAQVLKTVAQAPGAIISGSVEGGKMAASSIVGNRKTKKKKAIRGTSAARRRRSY